MIHQTIPFQALNDLLVHLAEQLHLEGCDGGNCSEVNIPTSHLLLYRIQVYFDPFTRENVLFVKISITLLLLTLLVFVLLHLDIESDQTNKG